MIGSSGDNSRWEGHHILIEDLEKKIPEGEVVSAQVAKTEERRGCILLPYEPQMLRSSAIGGYFMRRWGSGYDFPTVPSYVAPMTIFLRQELRNLHWAARLMPMEGVENSAGRIMLAQDNSRDGRVGGIASHTIQTFNIAEVVARPKDALGGWVIRDSSIVSTTSDGPCALALYGIALGLRVSWVAITQTG